MRYGKGKKFSSRFYIFFLDWSLIFTLKELLSTFSRQCVANTFRKMWLLCKIQDTAVSIQRYDSRDKSLRQLFCFRYGMAHIGRVASVLLTLCVTLERYYSVCHPMSPLRCKRHLLPASIVFSIVYNLPKFFEIHHSFVAVEHEYDGGEANHSMENDTNFQIKLVTSDLRLNWWYVTFYLFWSKFLFIELFPYILMVVMNYQIWKRITCLAFVSRGQRQRRSSRSTRSVRSNGQPG